MKEEELLMQNVPFFPRAESHVHSFCLVQECWQQCLHQQGWVSITALRCGQDKQIASGLSLTHLLLLVFMLIMLLLKGYPKVLTGKDSLLSSAKQM